MGLGMIPTTRRPGCSLRRRDEQSAEKEPRARVQVFTKEEVGKMNAAIDARASQFSVSATPLLDAEGACAAGTRSEEHVSADF